MSWLPRITSCTLPFAGHQAASAPSGSMLLATPTRTTTVSPSALFSPSLPSSRRTYVPGALKVAVVPAELGFTKETVPGPSTLLHVALGRHPRAAHRPLSCP